MHALERRPGPGWCTARAPTGRRRLYPVSLWNKLEQAADGRCSDADLADMLRRVHDALRCCPVALPSYLDAIDHARATLADDDRMRALSARDLRVLRASFETWAVQARAYPSEHQPLHGEPHPGNVVVTNEGPVLIDFEGTSIGPLEWDLASMTPAVADSFEGVHPDLLALTRLLNSARVATWCWALADHPVMRTHGEYHLAIIRQATGP